MFPVTLFKNCSHEPTCQTAIPWNSQSIDSASNQALVISCLNNHFWSAFPIRFVEILAKTASSIKSIPVYFWIISNISLGNLPLSDNTRFNKNSPPLLFCVYDCTSSRKDSIFEYSSSLIACSLPILSAFIFFATYLNCLAKEPNASLISLDLCQKFIFFVTSFLKRIRLSIVGDSFKTLRLS